MVSVRLIMRTNALMMYTQYMQYAPCTVHIQSCILNRTQFMLKIIYQLLLYQFDRSFKLICGISIESPLTFEASGCTTKFHGNSGLGKLTNVKLQKAHLSIEREKILNRFFCSYRGNLVTLFAERFENSIKNFRP